METQSGLTRRRGGGGGPGGSAGDTPDGEDRVKSPPPTNRPATEASTSYDMGANGHKIAYDPRDISESEERVKQPKLTLMEEVLLLGLKDKQVRCHMRRYDCLDDI